jgi:Dolichyl-phosphate-mannose-protein mannosyltransferase
MTHVIETSPSIKSRPSERKYSDWIAASLVIAACLSSSTVWILHDRRVWWWDQSAYGDWTLRLWPARLSGIREWAHAVITVLDGTPPLTVWLGQFFVPLRHLTGDVGSALLLANICAAAGTLVLVYLVSRRLGVSGLSSLAGVLVCAGSGLFIALTHLYYTEMTQCLAVAVCLAVACGSERRSLVRTLALLLAAVAVSFLAKSSSMTFVLPMLTYVALALWITGKKIRPAFRWFDAALMAGAVSISAAAVTWYALHWQSVVQHFVDATMSDLTLYWGSPVNLPTKLAHWSWALVFSLSGLPIFALCIAALAVAALAISLVRLRGRPAGERAGASVTNGTLFAFALAGTIVMTILTFALQINEDWRFLLPLIPIAGVLVAWSLSVLHNRMIELVLFSMVAANAAINHAYSLGFDPLHITAPPYLMPYDGNGHDRALLTEALHATCRREHAHRPNMIVVNYMTLNINLINFAATQESYTSGFRCSYTTYTLFDPDVQHALDMIRSIAPLYIVTVAPEKQPPFDPITVPAFVNGATRGVTEHLASDPQYTLESPPGTYLQIYRRNESE